MYRTLKNMFFAPNKKKKRRRTKPRDRVADEPDTNTEHDVRQTFELISRQNDDTYLNVSEDHCRLHDRLAARRSTINAAQIDAVAEVHFWEPLIDANLANTSPIHSMSAWLTADSSRLTPNTTTPAKSKATATAPSAAAAAGQSTAPPNTAKSAMKSAFEQFIDLFQKFSNLRTDVRIMMADQSIVYLLGTNHADPQCPLDVAEVIRKVKPQLVIIELCAWRACGCDLHRGNVFQTKPEFTFRYLRKVISQIGFLPAMIFFTDAFNEHHAVSSELLDYGGEFAVAARLCEQLEDCKILLGDREIPITVKRQASGMGNWRGIRVSVLVTMALIFKRRMKALLLRGHRLVIRDPLFYQIVVLERDIFLTYMIQVAAAMKHDVQKPQIVAVVGQGHLNGIQRFWGRILPQILPIILEPDLDF